MKEENLADGKSNARTLPATVSREFLFNGSSWDRKRANEDITIFSAAARTSDTDSDAQTNYNHRGAMLYADVTAVSGSSPTLNFDFEQGDPVTAAFKNVYRSVTINSTGDYQVILHSSADGTKYGNSTGTLAGNLDGVTLPLPRTWRIGAIIGGTTPSFTFSLGASMVL